MRVSSSIVNNDIILYDDYTFIVQFIKTDHLKLRSEKIGSFAKFCDRSLSYLKAHVWGYNYQSLSQNNTCEL